MKEVESHIVSGGVWKCEEEKEERILFYEALENQ